MITQKSTYTTLDWYIIPTTTTSKSKQRVGSKEKMVVLWKKLSSNKDEFISDIVLSSTKPNHEHFFLGDKDGYKLVVHPEMRGERTYDMTY